MSLQDDAQVPKEVRQGFLLSHMSNMRWRFPLGKHEGYASILRLVQSKRLGYQILTSNVDGAFIEAGFDRSRVYRPQGDWEWIQCARGSSCSSSSLWPSQPLLERLLPHIDPTTQCLPQSLIPKCPQCGGALMGNVRGGDWFLHHKALDEAQDRLIEWGEEMGRRAAKEGTNIVVVEVGCGWNTPIVTRMPAESFTRDTPGARLVRINPTNPEVPAELADRAVSIAAGWEVLLDIEEKVKVLVSREENEEEEKAAKRCAKKIRDAAEVSSRLRRGGNASGMNWKEMMLRLR
jgi:NAD-dependent SIR2 family protein deacetylase